MAIACNDTSQTGGQVNQYQEKKSKGQAILEMGLILLKRLQDKPTRNGSAPDCPRDKSRQVDPTDGSKAVWFSQQTVPAKVNLPQDKRPGTPTPTRGQGIDNKVTPGIHKTLSSDQVKAMLRKTLLSKINNDYAICVDDPCVNIEVDWEVMDKLVDKEFSDLGLNPLSDKEE